MANEAQLLAGRGVGGATARLSTTLLIPLTVSGTGTVSAGPINIPPGWISSIRTSTPVAISGTPTSCMVRVGITAAGQELMADVDLKAAQNSAATIPAAFDFVGAMPSALYAQVVTTAGTSPAGTINLLITIHPVG